jgi:hypothetical protein
MKLRFRRLSGILLLVCLLCLVAGCGNQRSSYSLNDAEYFAEPPIIVVQSNSYNLRWKYGSMGFYFEPECKIANGQLHFLLRATSSSGSLAGKYQDVPITDGKKLKALETGGAFWLEPSGTNVQLEIRRL